MGQPACLSPDPTVPRRLNYSLVRGSWPLALLKSSVMPIPPQVLQGRACSPGVGKALPLVPRAVYSSEEVKLPIYGSV